MVFVPCPEWLPDQADFDNPGSALIQNVYPRTLDSYGPIPAFTSSTLALTNRAQGAWGFRDTAGNAVDFAGDSTKLYYLNAGASAWTNISIAGGYHIAAADQWRFAQFGNNILVANINDNIQSSIISAGVPGTCTNLSANAPKATDIAIVRDFCMVGNTNDSVNGAKPQRLWWSAINDPTTWPTLGSTTASADQSDAQDVAGDHGFLQRVIPNVGPVDAVALFQGAVFRVMYIGAPDVFSILPARGVKGCIAPGSVVNTEIGVFYLGPDGFYIFDGINVIPIGYGKVDKWFFGMLDYSNVTRISACVDPIYPIVWVAFPSTAATGGNPDTILACNYRLPSKMGTPGRWSYAAATGLSGELVFRAVSLGVSLEQLDTYGTLENVPASLDSPIWQGNAQYVLAMFDASHILNYFTGPNLSPTVETSEAQIVEGKRARVKRALPIVDATSGTPSITPGTRARQQDSVTYGSASAMNSEGFCPLNAEGRFHRFRLTLPAGSTYNHIKGIVLPKEEVTATGGR